MNLLIALSLFFSIFGYQTTPIFSDYNQNPQKTTTLDPLEVRSSPRLENSETIFEGVTATGLALTDTKSGTILAYKNLDKNFATASITKLMTSLVVLENYDSDQVVTVSYKAASINGSKIHLLAGEQINVRNLIFGMLVGSGNDAAIALEEHFGEGELVNLMSQKAVELGMTNTHFADASGLSLENRSTPKDLTILTKSASKHPLIAQALQTRAITLTSVDGGAQHLIHTTNRLLKNYSDITGVKTGYTEEAGFCLISSAKRGEHELLLVLLGAKGDDARFDESRAILDRAFENITW